MQLVNREITQKKTQVKDYGRVIIGKNDLKIMYAFKIYVSTIYYILG